MLERLQAPVQDLFYACQVFVPAKAPQNVTTFHNDAAYSKNRITQCPDVGIWGGIRRQEPLSVYAFH